MTYIKFLRKTFIKMMKLEPFKNRRTKRIEDMCNINRKGKLANLEKFNYSPKKLTCKLKSLGLCKHYKNSEKRLLRAVTDMT